MTRPSNKRFDLIETHISWVFLGEHEVFKVKKPVDLGFLDFSSLERRQRACEAEVRLNSRLAPQAYLGVVPVTRTPGGEYAFEGAGEIVDWAVHMVRLPDAWRLDRRLAQSRLDAPAIDALARHLAGFHATARCDSETARYGQTQAIETNLRENFDQTRRLIGEYLSPADCRELEDWQLSFVRVHPELFGARIRQGRIRDGHGDLRLEQIYLDAQGAFTILDCIEFNDRFRYADVCADLAFLSMDLRFHGRSDLAERLLASYARESQDFGLYALVDFYESYRAFVRGKVSALLARDTGAPPQTRHQARGQARKHFELSLSKCRPSHRESRLIAVGGAIASGKSAIADWLSMHLGAAVVDTDRTRKHLLGTPATQRLQGEPWQGAYAPSVTQMVYTEILRRAEIVLTSGRPVILDATFRSSWLRLCARALARSRHAPFCFVECRAPESIRRQRLLARENEPSVSDARIELLNQFDNELGPEFEPVGELPESEHVIVDTSGPLQRCTKDLARRLEQDPGMTGAPSLRGRRSRA